MFYTLSERTVVKHSEHEAVTHAVSLIKDKDLNIKLSALPDNPSKEPTMTVEQLNKRVLQIYDTAQSW